MSAAIRGGQLGDEDGKRGMAESAAASVSGEKMGRGSCRCRLGVFVHTFFLSPDTQDVELALGTVVKGTQEFHCLDTGPVSAAF